MKNKYTSKCSQCGTKVNPGMGTIRKAGRRKWSCTCLECKPLSASEAMALSDGNEDHAAGLYAASQSQGRGYRSWGAYIPSTGSYIYQNKNGRCEDAPCCGCCS